MISGQIEQRARGRIGTVLRGKYRLDAVLGTGGMAVVYKATHRNQAEFAVKMLHPELSIHDDLRARFLREGYAANSVKHPGVVLVVDDDVAEDGAAFLVMELLDGLGCDNLSSLRGGRLPLDLACTVALDVLDVLVAAHAKDIVHRDLKPANLFLTRQGTVKVLDFGIARVRDTMTTGGQATGTGMVLGTPAFMAPEQAMGKTGDIDARSDLWAVGATVFALASGAMVHDAESSAELMVKVATQRPRSLAAVVPGAPAAVVAVVDRALAFERANRWPSAVAMRNALAAAQREAFGVADARGALAALIPPRAGGTGTLAAAGSDVWPAAAAPAPRSSETAVAPEGAMGALPEPRTMTAAALPSPSVASGVASGVQTNDAVSKSPGGLAAERAKGSSLAIGLATVAALAMGAGLFVALRSQPASPPAASPTASAGAPSLPIAASAAPPAALAGPLPPGPQPFVSASPAAATPEKSAGAVVDEKPAPVRKPPPRASATATPRASPGSAPASAPNCDPPFYFDAAGNRIYKKECL